MKTLDTSRPHLDLTGTNGVPPPIAAPEAVQMIRATALTPGMRVKYRGQVWLVTKATRNSNYMLWTGLLETAGKQAEVSHLLDTELELVDAPPAVEDKEPMELLMGDACLSIMKSHFPDNGEVYNEAQMLWGYIQSQMITAVRTIMASEKGLSASTEGVTASFTPDEVSGIAEAVSFALVDKKDYFDRCGTGEYDAEDFVNMANGYRCRAAAMFKLGQVHLADQLKEFATVCDDFATESEEYGD